MLDTLPCVPSTRPFVHLPLEPKLLERIDDFRFAFRFPSRNAAIRRLIEAGLEAELPSTIKPVKEPTSSAP